MLKKLQVFSAIKLSLTAKYSQFYPVPRKTATSLTRATSTVKLLKTTKPGPSLPSTASPLHSPSEIGTLSDLLTLVSRIAMMIFHATLPVPLKRVLP